MPKPEENLRLNVFISRATGISRRMADTAVLEGKIRINGMPVREPGIRVSENDLVEFNRKKIWIKEGETWLVLRKPVGFITTRKDPQKRPTVMELLPRNYRNLFPVGRLDYDTSGVLLFTDDGDTAHKLMHPGFQTPRIYEAQVEGSLNKDEVALIQRGVLISGKRANVAGLKFVKTKSASEVWRIELSEGRYHEVRLIFSAIGHNVVALERISFAGIEAWDIEYGRSRELNKKEIAGLKKRLEIYALQEK